MARLIDANALKEAMWNTDSDVYEFCQGRVTNMGISRLKLDDMIDDAPTVDAVEAVHGYWTYYSSRGECEYEYKCSVCEDWANNPYRYCPYCGANMDGDG